jgi:hypothetical protein
VYAARQPGTLAIDFPPTEGPVVRVRITLDTKRVPGWNEIDAVGLMPEG